MLIIDKWIETFNLTLPIPVKITVKYYYVDTHKYTTYCKLQFPRAYLFGSCYVKTATAKKNSNRKFDWNEHSNYVYLNDIFNTWFGRGALRVHLPPETRPDCFSETFSIRQKRRIKIWCVLIFKALRTAPAHSNQLLWLLTTALKVFKVFVLYTAAEWCYWNFHYFKVLWMQIKLKYINESHSCWTVAAVKFINNTVSYNVRDIQVIIFSSLMT